MRENPERIAWIIISLSFLTFCVLAVTVPWAGYRYVMTSTRPKEARLEVIEGTVQLEEPGLGITAGVRPEANPRPVREGARVKTDGSSRAFIRFFDQSGLTMATNTDVKLAVMRAPRFSLSSEPNRLEIEVDGGRATIGVALNVDRETELVVSTPQMTGVLAPGGNYELEVTNDGTQLVAYTGTAEVVAQGRAVRVAAGERTTVPLGQGPEDPVAAARPLIVNGDFTAPLEDGWGVWKDQGGDGGELDGIVQQVDEGDRYAVRFFRTGSESAPGRGNFAATGIRQEINRELPALASSLILQAEVKLINQSLSGGGQYSFEYPLILRLTYEDAYGSKAEWFHGFYYQNYTNNPTLNGQPIPRDIWFPFSSGNLLELNPPPFRIIALDIYAAGWDYESLVSRVRLVVE